MATGRTRAFEWWMLSGIGTGMAMSAFLSLLLPPFITDVTGSATRVGVVFAVISLVPVARPFLGRLAERTGRYRLLYMLSMLVMAATTRSLHRRRVPTSSARRCRG